MVHGGDNDVLWLQRDFHVYMVNVFDTEKACQVILLLLLFNPSHLAWTYVVVPLLAMDTISLLHLCIPSEASYQ